MMTCPGSIIVMSIQVNQNLLPRNRMRDSAYATREELSTVPKVATIVMKIEFLKKVPKVVPPKPFQPVA